MSFHEAAAAGLNEDVDSQASTVVLMDDFACSSDDGEGEDDASPTSSSARRSVERRWREKAAAGARGSGVNAGAGSSADDGAGGFAEPAPSQPYSHADLVKCSTDHGAVAAFVGIICRRVVPLELWGSARNRNLFIRKMRTFVAMTR